MITRSLLILFCLFLGKDVLLGQEAVKKGISVKEFTDNPWPFAPYLDIMQRNYSRVLKTEKFTMKSTADPSHKDTIIRLSKGKTEIFFFRPYNGKPYFIAANIYDKRVKLKGDVSVGITSQEFFSRVAFPDVGKDSVKISLPEGLYRTVIIMKNQRIDHIKIDARNKYK